MDQFREYWPQITSVIAAIFWFATSTSCFFLAEPMELPTDALGSVEIGGVGTHSAEPWYKMIRVDICIS